MPKVYIIIINTSKLLQEQRRHTHTHTHTYKFLSSCEDVKHHTSQLSWTSQLPTSSQHHSPTRMLPRNYTYSRIHAHIMPTHTSPTQSHTLMMERGFS